MKTLDDLAKLLEEKANNIERKMMEAQEKTALQIYQDVITDAPVGATGNYVESIDIEGPTNENGVIKSFVGSGLMVGPTKSKGKSYNLGYLLETGTNPHDIYPVESEFLVFDIDGKTIFTKHVWHPGTTAQPHYATAIQKNKKFYKNNIRKAWRGKWDYDSLFKKKWMRLRTLK